MLASKLLHLTYAYLCLSSVGCAFADEKCREPAFNIRYLIHHPAFVYSEVKSNQVVTALYGAYGSAYLRFHNPRPQVCWRSQRFSAMVTPHIYSPTPFFFCRVPDKKAADGAIFKVFSMNPQPPYHKVDALSTRPHDQLSIVKARQNLRLWIHMWIGYIWIQISHVTSPSLKLVRYNWIDPVLSSFWQFCMSVHNWHIWIFWFTSKAVSVIKYITESVRYNKTVE